MIKNKLLIGAGLIAGPVLLSGCASVGEVFIGATNAAYVIDMNGSIKETITKADLSQDELNAVNEAQVVILSLREKFESATLENLLLLHVDYYKAKTAYERVYDVVVAHKNEYTQDEWQAFVDAHNAAVELDESVNDYIMSPNASGAANMTLQYLNAAAKLAALL